MKTSTPILHNTPQYRREPVPTPPSRHTLRTPVKDRGVFGTLYHPDSVKRNTSSSTLKQTTYKNSYRHSSFTPVNMSNNVYSDLDIVEESTNTDESFAEYKERKAAKIS